MLILQTNMVVCKIMEKYFQQYMKKTLGEIWVRAKIIIGDSNMKDKKSGTRFKIIYLEFKNLLKIVIQLL